LTLYVKLANKIAGAITSCPVIGNVEIWLCFLSKGLEGVALYENLVIKNMPTTKVVP